MRSDIPNPAAVVFFMAVSTFVIWIILGIKHQDGVDEAVQRNKRMRAQSCELLGGKMFENGGCYRRVDGTIVPVTIPPLPKESK